MALHVAVSCERASDPKPGKAPLTAVEFFKPLCSAELACVSQLKFFDLIGDAQQQPAAAPLDLQCRWRPA